jgi:hypothetical protein
MTESRRLAALPVDPAMVVRAVPGVVRLVATSSWRAASWTVGSSVSTGTGLVRRSMHGEPVGLILQEATADLRTFAWRALGVREQTTESGVPERIAPGGATAEELRARGDALLRRSADVRVVEDTHPAYARILSEITPDEARILRYLYLEGPQPAIDVRTNRPLGIGSQLVAGGLNMIAEFAGCRNVDRIHPYLTNLSRLGLVEFSKEQVADPQRYQLIEAQPNVAAALKRAGRVPKTIHRSIHLNAFGEDFCRTCLPLEPPGVFAVATAAEPGA